MLCDDVWDQTSREMLAWNMQTAEEMIASELGFYPAPKFVTNERHLFGHTGVRWDWENAELKTDWSYVECYGTETLTLVQADATVTYSIGNANPNDRENLATISTGLYADLPACDNACDVVVFFRVADGAIDAADYRFEIRPLNVDIDGSTMHITGESSLFVMPTLWNLTKLDCDGSDEPNKWRWEFDTSYLVTAVDVYCRSINQQSPVTLMWDGVCNCSGVCQHKTQTACAYTTDLSRGFFVPRPSSWNGTTNIDAAPTYDYPPEGVKVSYRAGYPLNSFCRMDPRLERAIVKLTNVLLPEPPCEFCGEAAQHWHDDRKPIDPLTPEAANMPWDLYERGALEAWRIVKRLARGQGGKLGRY